MNYLYQVWGYFMSTFITPLRYPGGKARLGPWLAELLRHNGISGGCYVEPYAGGAGAALFLLMRGYVNHIIINDVDPVIYAFWWSILNKNNELLSLIDNTEINMENWYRQKEILAKSDAHDTLSVGFATFFLNRTNRSGILSGGVIGGKNQSGNYKIDARFNKFKLSERIKKIGEMKKHITLYNHDAMELIDIIEPTLPAKSLIYLDPPYYEKGSQLYRNHYKPDDHKKIATRVSRLAVPALVTYDNCSPIKELYSSEKTIEFSLRYSTHTSRTEVTELMVYKNIELHSAPVLSR